jgi:predicted outer membrane lipoprotein
MITGILLFQAVAFAVLSAIVASNKNRDPAGWGIIGFLFGLFGFVAALVVEEVEPEEKQRTSKKKRSSSSQKFNPDEHDKKCPMCAEYIKLEARRCKHCGHEFSEREVEKQIEEVKEEEEALEGERYCKRYGTGVFPEGVECPECGWGIEDGKHPPLEEKRGTDAQE